MARTDSEAEAYLKLELRRAFGIAYEALTWVGTPYHHQASKKGVGCDCLGLVRGVWRALYGAEPEIAPAYSRDWGEANGQELMLGAFRRHMNEIEVPRAITGDVICLRWKPRLVIKHCMILTGKDTAVHALNNNPVAEVHLNDDWRRKIAAAFRFPELR